jgi:hypothetical protein
VQEGNRRDTVARGPERPVRRREPRLQFEQLLANCRTPPRSTSAPTRATWSRTWRSGAWTPSSWTACRPPRPSGERPAPRARRRALQRDQNALPFRNDARVRRCATRSMRRSRRSGDGTLSEISVRWLGLDVTGPANCGGRSSRGRSHRGADDRGRDGGRDAEGAEEPASE